MKLYNIPTWEQNMGTGRTRFRHYHSDIAISTLPPVSVEFGSFFLDETRLSTSSTLDRILWDYHHYHYCHTASIFTSSIFPLYAYDLEQISALFGLDTFDWIDKRQKKSYCGEIKGQAGPIVHLLIPIIIDPFYLLSIEKPVTAKHVPGDECGG